MKPIFGYIALALGCVLAFWAVLSLTSCTPPPAPSTLITSPGCNCMVDPKTQQLSGCVCPGEQVKWPYAEEVRAALTPGMLAKGPGNDLCLGYDKLTMPWKVEAWVAVLGGISWTESEWKLVTKPFIEPNLPVDKITGLPTYSEGLFQLSYGDKKNYPNASWCQKIDYAKKNISDKDINIQCSLQIMDALLAKGRPLSAYWSSANQLRPGFSKTMTKVKALYKGCGV
jgi:hypothetical protein